MANYMVLGKFTDQGIRNVKDTVKRAAAIKELAASLGIAVKENYWFLGEFDVGFIADAPDEASITALGLSDGALGNVTTQTLRAFSSEEISRILGQVAV